MSDRQRHAVLFAVFLSSALSIVLLLAVLKAWHDNDKLTEQVSEQSALNTCILQHDNAIWRPNYKISKQDATQADYDQWRDALGLRVKLADALDALEVGDSGEFDALKTAGLCD